MSNGPPARLRDRFWTRFPLNQLSQAEWEALCDGCGKCCLNKLEDEDTGEVAFTRIACRLLDPDSCQCAHYSERKRLVPECLVLSPDTLPDIAYFMPRSCAYRRLYDGRPLPDWHPLISGRADSVHTAGQSVQGWTLSEFDVPVEDWEDHVIDEEL